MTLQRTAADVAEMESELILTRSERDQLRTQVALLTQDNSRLGADLAMAQNAAREEMIRATQIETIMEQVSMGLVAGLQKLRSKKQADRDNRRYQQERDLQVGGEDPPPLREPVQEGRPPPSSPPAAPRMVPRRPSLDSGMPIERLSGRSSGPFDPRMPRIDLPPRNEDEDNLRDLAGQIGKDAAQ